MTLLEIIKNKLEGKTILLYMTKIKVRNIDESFHLNMIMIEGKNTGGRDCRFHIKLNHEFEIITKE